jgi:hypothetical protein
LIQSKHSDQQILKTNVIFQNCLIEFFMG